jgi:hypothetical protein
MNLRPTSVSLLVSQTNAGTTFNTFADPKESMRRTIVEAKMKQADDGPYIVIQITVRIDMQKRPIVGLF